MTCTVPSNGRRSVVVLGQRTFTNRAGSLTQKRWTGHRQHLFGLTAPSVPSPP